MNLDDWVLTRDKDVMALRQHVDKMRPSPCCEQQPMYESGGKVTMMCNETCPWSELDRLIANVSIYVYNP